MKINGFVFGCLTLALALRIVAALFHHYIAPLPDGVDDAVNFDRMAAELSRLDFLQIWGNFEGSSSYFYALALAYVYNLTTYHPLIGQLVSVLFGTLCVYLTIRVSRELWGDGSSTLAAWAVCLMPTLIMYSAITRREVYVIALLLGALIFIIRWVRDDKWRNAGAGLILMGLSVLFHTGMLAGVAAFMLIVCGRCLTKFLARLTRGRFSLASGFVVLFVFCATAVALAIDPSIQKMGPLSGLLTPSPYLAILQNRVQGDAAYPDWMVAQCAWDLIWLVPARTLYLLYSPFPWDVSHLWHTIGQFDAATYVLATAAIFASWKAIRQNEAALAVLFIVGVLAISFGIGTGNFGTALRHRAKLFPVMAILAVPVIYQIEWMVSSVRRAAFDKPDIR